MSNFFNKFQIQKTNGQEPKTRTFNLGKECVDTFEHKIDSTSTKPIEPTTQANPVVIYETNNKGKKVLKLVQTSNKSEIQTLNGSPLYRFVQGKKCTKETIYSKDNKKLYEILRNPNGHYRKTLFADNGVDIRAIVDFDEKDNVLRKRVMESTKKHLNKGAENGLPQYLYNFTSIRNYEKMGNDGVIRTTTDNTLKREGNEAVFLADGDNHVNNWNSVENGNETSYITRLLKYCDKDKMGNIIMLKIPTAKLAKEGFTFRNQDWVMNNFPMFDLPKKEQEEYFAFSKLMSKIHKDKKLQNQGIENNIFMPDRMKHLIEGAPIKELENHSTAPYEILYKNDIPFDAIEDIKLIDIRPIINMPLYSAKTERMSKYLVKEALS